MPDTRLMMVRIILDDERHANQVAETLVMERLAATASVEAPHSVYRIARGQLGLFTEFTVVAVTTREGFENLCVRASTMPGVVVPGILATAVDTAHPALEPFIRAVTDQVV